MKKSRLFLTPILMTILYGCNDKSVARVSCTDVEMFECRSGVLNIGHWTHGMVLTLNLDTKQAIYCVTVPLKPEDIGAADTPIDTMELLTKTHFDVQLSGDITKDPNFETIKIEAKNTVANNTMFFLENSFRRNIKNPLEVINADSASIRTMKNYGKSNIVFMMVTGIVFADAFKFLVKKSVTVGAEADVVTVGKFSVAVSYECQGSLNIDAKEGGVFFKPGFFTYDAVSGKMVPYNGEISLLDFNLAFGMY